MSETALYEKATSVLKEKERAKKVEILDDILDQLLIVAEASGTLDLTPYIVGCFVAEPNDPINTAVVIEATQLLNKIPILKNKEKFKQLFKGRPEGVKGLIKASSGDAQDVTVTFNLQMLTNIANQRYGPQHSDKLSAGMVYQAAIDIVDYI